MHQHVERAIEIPASPSEVWQALSNPERLADWLGGATDLHLVPDSDFTFVDGSGARHGHVLQVVPETLIQFWWASEGGEGSVVTIELEPTRVGARVVIVETPATISDATHEQTRGPIGFQHPTFADAAS